SVSRLAGMTATGLETDPLYVPSPMSYLPVSPKSNAYRTPAFASAVAGSNGKLKVTFPVVPSATGGPADRVAEGSALTTVRVAPVSATGVPYPSLTRIAIG